MTTTVTMLQTRLGENGSLWTIGNSYAASDAFAAVLISSNLATGTLPKSRGLVPLWGQTDNTGAVASVVDAGGKVQPIASYGRRLALFGDSRTANGYLVIAPPTAVSVSGSVVTVTNTNIGLSVGVGDQIVLGRNTGCNYMRATVATIPDANNITANINFPVAGLPSGSIRNGNSVVVALTRRPTYPTTFAAWLLMLLGQPFEFVDCYAFNGATEDGVLDGQIADALGVGFDAAWVQVSVNDYATSLGNLDSAYCIAKYQAIVSKLAGRPLWIFLEYPLSGGTYDTATNRARIAAINTWAQTSGARVVDVYSPLNDGTGAARTGWLLDGLHTGLQGALNGALSVYQTMGIPVLHRAATTIGAGSNRFPLTNPTMAGTLGASQLPTGYSKSVSGLVSESGYGLQAKADGTGNEFYIDLVSTGVGQQFIRSASTAVTAGVKYRVRFKIQAIGMVGFEQIEVTLRNNAGDASLGNLMVANSSGIQQTGDADGTWTISGEQDIVIPAGVTNAYYRPRLYFDGAGGGRIVHSDVSFEAVA